MNIYLGHRSLVPLSARSVPWSPPVQDESQGHALRPSFLNPNPLSPGQHSYRTSREETEAARAAGSQVSAIMAVCGSGSTVCPLYHLMPSVCAYLYLNDSVLSVRMTQQRVSIQQTFVAKRKAINKQTGSRCEVFPHFWSLQPSMCTGN